MTARAFGQVLGGGYGQRKSRDNSAAPTDPVRAYSYDVDSAKANPHRPIGDGTPKQKWAFTKALEGTLEELFTSQRDEGYRGPFRIQPSYLHVWKTALDRFLNPRTGEFIFSAQALADASRLRIGTVKRCILALEAHGLLCHVRRSRAVAEREGMPGWQRETAPNAYYFDCKARMPRPVWEAFWKRLMANLKKIEKIAARAAHAIAGCFNSVARPSPREPNTELQLLLARVQAGITARDEAAIKKRDPLPSSRSVSS